MEIILSGLTNVSLEYILKNDLPEISVWDRNIQLSAFSLVIYAPTFVRDGYFENWNEFYD